MKKKDKKGELTTTQIVTLIVLIASFIIILFLIFRLNLGQTTDQEICRNSVVLRGQSKLVSGPLDCKTQYVCISGGEDCRDFSVTEKIEAKTKEEAMKALAEQMSSCWHIFGEDKKIKYAGGFGETGVYCAVCAIIDFDGQLQDKLKEISYLEFYDYLRITKRTESQTYLQYLYGISDLSLFESQEQVNININTDKIMTDQKYSILTGIIDTNVPDFAERFEWLKVYIIPTSETEQTSCSEFVTKA